jgi:hypothetical protein
MRAIIESCVAARLSWIGRASKTTYHREGAVQVGEVDIIRGGHFV